MKLTAKLILGTLLLLSSCKPLDPNKQVDEGSVENSTYSSKELGWTMTIPEGWNVISRAQNEAMAQKGLEALEETIGEKVDTQDLKDLIGFQKDPFNSFQSTSQSFVEEYEGEWLENDIGLKKLLYETYVNQGIKTDSSETTIVTIDGVDFRSYQYTISDPSGNRIMSQIMYTALINGLDFGANINYNSENTKKELLETWLNSKFKK